MTPLWDSDSTWRTRESDTDTGKAAVMSCSRQAACCVRSTAILSSCWLCGKIQWCFNAVYISFGFYFNLTLPTTKYFPVVILNKWLMFSFYLWSWIWIQNLSRFSLPAAPHWLSVTYNWVDLFGGFRICFFCFIKIVSAEILKKHFSLSSVCSHLSLLSSRCQSTSPCPAFSASKRQSQQPLLSDGENSGKQSRYVRTDGRFLARAGWNVNTASLSSGASLAGDADSQGRLTKSKSISCLDNRLSIYKPPAQIKSCQESQAVQEQKDKQGDLSAQDGLNGRPLSWSTLSLGPNQTHKRTLSLTRSVPGVPPTTIRKKITEWECRRVSLPRMSLCLDKRGGERVGGSEGCPSLLSSPCSEKTFDFKGVRRMSTAFSECSYTEEEEGVPDKDGLGRFQKRIGKPESSGTFVRSLSARKETSAVLNRIQKIEQALKDNPSPPPPRYLSNCYAPDKTRQKSFVIGDDFDSTCTSKRSSICSVATEPDAVVVSDKLAKLRQRFSVSSARSESPEPPGQHVAAGTPVNPLPKPKRTFEYDSKRDQKGALPANGLPPNRASESPPPLPSTPAPGVPRSAKAEGRIQDRWEHRGEDART